MKSAFTEEMLQSMAKVESTREARMKAVLTRFTAWFYTFDTNTDVCPSLHVVGSLAAYFGLRDCRRFRSRGWQIGSALAAAAICLSTLFLKQHSAVDVLAALPLCAIAYLLIYRRKTV